MDDGGDGSGVLFEGCFGIGLRVDRLPFALHPGREFLLQPDDFGALFGCFGSKGLLLMTLRPVSQIPQHVITPLLLVCLDQDEIQSLLGKEGQGASLVALIQDLYWQAKSNRAIALVVEERLDDAFKEMCPTGDSISALSPILSDAYRGNDPILLSAILWHVSRQPGLAWRKAEVRILAALTVFILSSASVPAGGSLLDWQSRANNSRSRRLSRPALIEGGAPSACRRRSLG